MGFPNCCQKGRIMVKQIWPAVQETVTIEKFCYSSQADRTWYGTDQHSTAHLCIQDNTGSSRLAGRQRE